MAARLEEDGEPARALEIKRALMGPFGGTGDSLYWGGAIPFLASAALLAGWSGSAWAAWMMVALFGMANLLSRALFFRIGYLQGVAGIGVIQRLKLLVWARRLKWGAAILLGASLTRAMEATGAVDKYIWAPVAAAGVALVVAALARRGFDPAWIVYPIAGMALGAAFWIG